MAGTLSPTGLAISAGGSLIGALAGAAAARKRNGILQQGILQQGRAGQEATQAEGDAVSNLLNIRPDASAERGAFTSALGSGGVSVPMTASHVAQAGAQAATGAAQGYGRNLADLWARIRAPQLAQQQQQYALQDAGNQIRGIQNTAQGDAFLTQLRAGQVQANPLTQVLGQGLTAAGGYAARNPGVWGKIGKLFGGGSG